MLPYTAAAVYTNQLQQAAMPYQQHQNQQRPPSPSSSLHLAATLNLERLRYGLTPQGLVVSAAGAMTGCGGVVGPNQAQGGSPVAGGYPPAMFQHAAAFDPMTLAAAGFRHAFDPRTGRFLPPEEPKPQHSYIGLIAMAILSNSEKKMVLSDIYQWILDHYPYFRTRGPGWRNSIRHNLSLNDCFIKAGRSANGKGHYWAVHPANVEDFKKGDFRRRRAQRKVRKHMGLAVPDDEDDSDDSQCSSPAVGGNNFFVNGSLAPAAPTVLAPLPAISGPPVGQNLTGPKMAPTLLGDGSGNPTANDESGKEEKKQDEQPAKRKRLFDMDSLLSPSNSEDKRNRTESGTPDGPKAENQSGAGAVQLAHPGYNRPPQMINPFFFPPPFQSGGAVNENGHLLAAMAAAAAGFMPFAFLPTSGPNSAGLPWNFGCMPQSSAASALATFLPNGQAYRQAYPQASGIWQNGTANTNSVSPTSSKTAASPEFGNGEMGTNRETTPEQIGDHKSAGSSTRTPVPQDTAAQWQETFAKIMARSYQGRHLIKGGASGNKGTHHAGDADGDEDTKSPRCTQPEKLAS